MDIVVRRRAVDRRTCADVHETTIRPITDAKVD
jgi:hypothetical protein